MNALKLSFRGRFCALGLIGEVAKSVGLALLCMIGISWTSVAFADGIVGRGNSDPDTASSDAAEQRSFEKLNKINSNSYGPADPNTIRLSTDSAKPPAEKRRTLVWWKMGLDSESFSDQKEHAQIVGLGLDGELRTLLLPGLMIRLKAGVDLQSGYAQSEFGDTVPHNGVLLKEAVIQYHPWKPLYFQVGAIDEEFVGSPFLPGGAYPGLLQKVALGSDRLGVDVVAQEMVPTSTTLSTETVDNEPTPYYLTQGLTFKWQPFNPWQLKATAMHYKFENLPSSVALDSLSYGNTILATGPNSSQFMYQFDGWMGGAQSRVRVVRGLDWTIGGHALSNTAAAQSYGDAEWVETGFDIGLPGDIDLIPRAASFIAESDVAPGFYNSSEDGHNNRKGWSAIFDVLFKKQQFKVGATYTDADVINPTPYQSREQYIQLRFESLYELL